MARFAADNIIERVFYYSNGNLAGTLKGYQEDKLPEEIRSMVSNSYNGYVIIYADEAEVTGKTDAPVYIVHLQSLTGIKLVQICDGEMDIVFDSEKNIENPQRF